MAQKLLLHALTSLVVLLLHLLLARLDPATHWRLLSRYKPARRKVKALEDGLRP